MTTWGQGQAPVWTNTGSNLSSSSESQTEGDSGIGSYQKLQGSTGSTTRHDHTPQYSPETIRKLDEGDLKDAPLSDHSGKSDRDQEMVSRDYGAEEATGTNPIQPTGPVATVKSLAANLTVAPEALEGAEELGALLLSDPADMDDEKACWDAFQLIMQGFHITTRTLSDSYQQACKEVQTIVWRSLRKSTAIDHTFVWGALAATHQWVRAIHLTIDYMGESLEEQSRLLQTAWLAGKEATEDILALLLPEESLYLTPVVPKEHILTLTLQATRTHTEKAIEAG